jgi:hypothetical protein
LSPSVFFVRKQIEFLRVSDFDGRDWSRRSAVDWDGLDILGESFPGSVLDLLIA